MLFVRSTLQRARTKAVTTARTSVAHSFLGSLIGNATGFALPILLVHYLQAGRRTDIYFLAYGLGLVLYSILSPVLEGNSLAAATEARRGGPAALAQFTKKTLRQSYAVATLGALITLAVGYFVALVQHDWTNRDVTTFYWCLLGMMAWIILDAANSVYDGIAFSSGIFGRTLASNALRPAAAALAIAIPMKGPGRVVLLTGALIVGEFARGVVVRRIVATITPCEASVELAVSPSIWRTSTPQFLSALFASSNPMIDRIFASRTGSGNVTALDIVGRILQVPTTLVGTSIILVSGSAWSLLALERPGQLHQAVKKSLRRILIVAAIVVTVGAASTLLWGKFFRTHLNLLHSTPFTHMMLWGLLTVPSFFILSWGTRFATATRQTRFLVIFASCTFIANLIADAVGVHYWGLVGIVGATVIVRGVSSTCMMFYVLGRSKRMVLSA